VADGGQARVVGITGDRRGLTVLREMTSVDAQRRTRDLVPDSLGRSFDSASAARDAIAPRDEAHEEARRRFIDQLAVMLIEDNRARQFDELILIIPSPLSGTLHDALDEATRARVRETLAKDLTKAPLPDIVERLVEAGLLPAPDPTS
jgi:protein required for attachment to host cells